AVTTKRSYHEVLTTDEAISIMSKSVGKKLDPDLFEVLAKNVRKLVMEGSRKELPDDFDPCQPHNELPFIEPDVRKQKHDLFGHKETKKYGKIKVDSIRAKGEAGKIVDIEKQKEAIKSVTKEMDEDADWNIVENIDGEEQKNKIDFSENIDLDNEASSSRKKKAS
ncbi:MAG: hypothetical protein KAQ98_09265, partial [Bacteriovoracaceae bacterium]|nr:hypothetical protein [Bacteriovoracaceae bacterium]